MTATRERLKGFLEKRAVLVNEERAEFDRITADGYTATAEDRAKLDAFETRGADLDKMIEAEARNLERESQGVQLGDTLGDLGSKKSAYREQRGQFDTEIRQWLKGPKTEEFRIEHGGSFTGRATDWLDEMRAHYEAGGIEERALNVTTASAGGNLVTQQFADKLYEHMIEDAVLVKEISLLTTQTGEAFTYPKTLTHPSGAAVAESGTFAQSEPTFGKTTLNAYKYGNLILVSRELVEDNSFDLLGYLARQAGRAIGNIFGQKIVAGAGSTEPRGITIDSTLAVTGAAAVAGAFTADNLIDLEYAVIEAYAMRAAYLCRRATVGAMRKLKDTAGQYLWSAAVVPGQRDTFDGQRIIQDPNVAAVALSAKSVLFGDYSAYVARIVRGIRFERSDDFKFDADQIAFRVAIRGDGALMDLTGAVKHFIGNAA